MNTIETTAAAAFVPALQALAVSVWATWEKVNDAAGGSSLGTSILETAARDLEDAATLIAVNAPDLEDVLEALSEDARRLERDSKRAGIQGDGLAAMLRLLLAKMAVQ